MSEHTKGRLEAFTQESFSGWYALRDQDHFEVGSGDGGFDEADARRLAACWNALENIDQETLDMGWTGIGCMEAVHKHEERAASLAKELAAARALLREALIIMQGSADDLNDDDISKTLESFARDRIASYLDACDTLEGAPNAG